MAVREGDSPVHRRHRRPADPRRANAPADRPRTRSNKAYPASFEEAGVQSPNTLFGQFKLRLTDGDHRCRITVGDYSKDGFEVFWDSDAAEKGWQVDG